MTVATPPHCRTVRSWISAASDDELTVDRQIVMNSHLASCDRCRRARDEIAVLGIALRRGAAEQRPDDTAFAGLATEVLARTPFEQHASRRRRVREVVEEGLGLWLVGGALSATLAVTVLIATLQSVAPPVEPLSLSEVASWEFANLKGMALRTSMVLGSNANPISPVDGTTLPRVWPDDAVMLIQPLPPRSLENLTLTAVVTRQGQLASLRALHEGPPDADLAKAISRLRSGVRFVPARAGGAPVAMTVVWLLERMTVRGET